VVKRFYLHFVLVFILAFSLFSFVANASEYNEEYAEEHEHDESCDHEHEYCDDYVVYGFDYDSENVTSFQEDLAKYGIELVFVDDDGTIFMLEYFNVDPYGNIDYRYKEISLLEDMIYIDINDVNELDLNNVLYKNAKKSRYVIEEAQCGICGGSYFSITYTTRNDFFDVLKHSMGDVSHYDSAYMYMKFAHKVCTTCGNKYTVLLENSPYTYCPGF
jgi:hypothetical protein